MQFKYYFNNLSTKHKILLFMLVPLTLFLLFNILSKLVLNDKLKSINQQIIVYKQNIKKLQLENTKVNNISSIKYLENISSKFMLKILNIKLSKNELSIEVTGDFKNIINFLNQIEQSMKSKNIQIYKSDKSLIILQGSFKPMKPFSTDDIGMLNSIYNPFNTIKQTTDNKSKSSLNLIAIIDKYVCINDKWYIKGDKFRNYIIKDILVDHIILKTKNKIIKLGLPKNAK